MLFRTQKYSTKQTIQQKIIAYVDGKFIYARNIAFRVDGKIFFQRKVIKLF